MKATPGFLHHDRSRALPFSNRSDVLKSNGLEGITVPCQECSQWRIYSRVVRFLFRDRRGEHAGTSRSRLHQLARVRMVWPNPSIR
nr:hypothetical protein CFP56_10438 [Quercus suber]